MIIEINDDIIINTDYIVKIGQVYKAFNTGKFELCIYHLDGRYTTITNHDEHKLKALRFDLKNALSDKIKSIKFYK